MYSHSTLSIIAIVDDLVMILQYVCFVKRLSVEWARRNGDDKSKGMETMNVSLTILMILDKTIRILEMETESLTCICFREV